MIDGMEGEPEAAVEPRAWSERVVELRDERDRLLALGVGDHLPLEVSLQISQLEGRRRALEQRAVA